MVKKIQANEFDTLVNASAAAVVDFSATWCGPCRMMAPVLEGISDQMAGKVDFFNVDVDEAPQLAAKFQISSIPCLVLLKNGVAVDQSIGLKPEAQLVSWIQGNL